MKKISFNLSTCSLALFALMPVLPLFVPLHLNPIPSFHDEWLALIVGLLAWLTALPLLWRQQQLLVPRLALLPLILMAFIAIQTQLSPVVVVQHAQMGMLYLLWAAFLMVLVKLLVEQTNRQHVSQWVAMGLSAAAVFASLIELNYRLKGVSGGWGGTAQANNYADLLALGLISALYLSNCCQSAYRAYFLMLAAIIVLGLSLTPSRSVWLYWAAVLFIAFLLQRHHLKWLVTGLGFYLALQVVLSVHPLANDQLSSTSAEKLYQSVAGTSTRLHIWKVAWQLFLDSPWLGQGFGQFDWAYFQAGQYIPELPSRLEHAHNLILHLLAELGIFPALLFISLLALWLKPILVTIRQTPENDDSNLGFYAWLLSLLAILGIHSLLEYPLWYAQFLGIAAIVLSLGETNYWQLRLKPVFTLAFSAFISLGIMIASVHEWHYAKIEHTMLTYSQSYLHSDRDQLIAQSRLANLSAPLLSPYVAIIFSSVSVEDISNPDLRLVLTTLNNVGYHFLPTPALVYRQAELQALNGFKNQAQQTMKLAIKAYPDWATHFVENLIVLNSKEQKEIEFLKKMATEK